MTSRYLTAILAATLGGSSVLAHHSWAGFDTDPITIEATIEGVKIENPHTLVELRATDGRPYTIVWFALNGMRRHGLLDGERSLTRLLKPGDDMVVTGRIKRTESRTELLPQRLEHRVHGLIWPKAPG